jgi:hypothetical protein
MELSIEVVEVAATQPLLIYLSELLVLVVLAS